ncbi:MAG: glycerophosphodiester phosphodiesterase [Chloroflexia bacterium]|nr:glycerophosphodiester phosphodiesterase [Chloroflexia bacterium]
MHTTIHPRLPVARPLVIAHRAGNDLATARRAEALGADLVEVDVWSYRQRIELRHVKTMGPLPLLWDRWTLQPGWRHRFVLSELLAGTKVDTRLLLDLKGKDTSLAEHVVATIRGGQPARQIILCGRNWAQLDPVAADEELTIFYSVGSDDELRAVWAKLARTAHPAVSIHARYLTPRLTQRFHDARTTVISWPINDIALARHLFDLGVDGFTTDNIPLLERIARDRVRWLTDPNPSDQTHAPHRDTTPVPAED